MEISQQVLYVVCYGAIAVAVWRAGTPFPVLLGFCVLEIPHSWWSGRLVPAADLAMLALAVLVCAEAAYHAVRDDRPWGCIAAMALGSIAAILVELGLRGTPLTLRHAVIVAAASALGSLALLDLVRALECSRYARINLRLLCLWMWARVASSLGFEYYRVPLSATDSLIRWSWAKWFVAGWMFLFCLAVIALLYWLSFRGRAEPRAAYHR